MSYVKIEGNASGTGTFTIAAPNSNTDRVLTLPDEAGTVLTSASSITQNAGPAFSARMSSSQSISTGTATKVQFNTEFFDTDSCYDTSTYRFTPTVAGYYQVNSGFFYNIVDTTGIDARIHVYKNGSNYKRAFFGFASPNAYYGCVISTAVYLNGSTDYIEIYTLQGSGSSQDLGNYGNAADNWFDAYLIRA